MNIIMKKILLAINHDLFQKDIITFQEFKSINEEIMKEEIK